MYYKVIDQLSGTTVPEVFNVESEKDVKNGIKGLLIQEMSLEDAEELSSLKWDAYVKRMGESGFSIEWQPTPYEMDDFGDLDPDWEGEYDDDWDYNDNAF